MWKSFQMQRKCYAQSFCKWDLKNRQRGALALINTKVMLNIKQELGKVAHIRPEGLVSEMGSNYTDQFLSLELFYSESEVYYQSEI